MTEGVAIALISALGVAVFGLVVKGVQWFVGWFRKSQPERVESARYHEMVLQADESITLAGKSRVMLAEDYERARGEIADLHARHAQDRLVWNQERDRLNTIIEQQDARLENMRREFDELEDRLNEALSEVKHLRERYNV